MSGTERYTDSLLCQLTQAVADAEHYRKRCIELEKEKKSKPHPLVQLHYDAQKTFMTNLQYLETLTNWIVTQEKRIDALEKRLEKAGIPAKEEE